MGAEKVKSKCFVGVYWRESDNPQRTHNGRRDRCYYFNFRDAGGKQRLITVGWASQGITEQLANAKRQEAITGATSSVFVSTVADKKLTLDTAFELYKEWATGEGKYVDREAGRWNKHVKPHFGHFPLDALTEDHLNTRKAELVQAGAA